MRKKFLPIALAVFIFVLSVASGFLFFSPLSGGNASVAFAQGEAALVIDGQDIGSGNYSIVQDGKVLIPVSVLKDYIYKDVALSSDGSRLNVTVVNPQFKLETEALDKMIEKGVTLNFQVQKINNIPYVNLSGIEKIFGIAVNYFNSTSILAIDKIKETMETGKVNDTTYLRTKPSSVASQVDKLQAGSSLVVFDRDGSWLRVRTDKGYAGYVLEDKVDVTVVEGTSIIQQSNANQGSEKTGKIKKWTYLRTKESSTATRIVKLEVGNEITILEDNGKWLKAKTSDGKEGYVLSDKVEIVIKASNGSQSNEQAETGSKTGKVNKWTYLRKSKSSSSSSIVKLNTGDEITILEDNGKWLKARTSAGKEGYVLSSKVDIVKTESAQEQSSEKTGSVEKLTYLRTKESLSGARVAKLEKGDSLIILEDNGKWLKAKTQDGKEGYVQSDKIKITVITASNTLQDKLLKQKLNNVRETWKSDGKINLVWEYVSRTSPDLSKEEKIEGLDVISPTWFSITSANGYVVNNGDKKYVEDAHQKGYKVWGLVDNSFDKDLTKKLFTDAAAQQNVINQLVVYASLYNLDGINIDFENVYYEDKDNLTKFVDNLTKALKMQNLIVSIDMTIPSTSPTWSMFYDREKLGKIVDYCMVMTYDEHWSASPVSGSVASINWVDNGIKKTLQYIPKEKLIMGIPFYTREWEETTQSNGKVSVKSKALTMATVKARITENKSAITWLNDVGQNYTEYYKDGKRYRIWIEDAVSIDLKAKLVHKYNIAGAASWRRGFEDKEIWTVLNNVLKLNNKIASK